MPPVTCDIPAEGKLVDVSGTTNVVGDGTPASCTEQALRAAVAVGGAIRFACGAAPITIVLTQPLVINNVAGADMLGDTTIDGGGIVTLSGGNATRIITLDACSMPFNSPHCDTFPHPHLTVERLAFVDGLDSGTDGGGAILRRGGALTVIDSQFKNNRGAMTGQDTAGGALRLVYATPALIVGSTFDGNRCSNGGAIGSLQAAPVAIINTAITNNTATGTGGNPGNGGNGGGIYHDGVSLALSLCGVSVRSNHGNAYGGGIFYVDDAGQGTVAITNSEISDNDIPVVTGKPSHGGAGYLQGAVITLANTTIANDRAGFAAGLYVNAMNGMGSLDATNLTVTGMTTGDGLTIENLGGTLLDATIAGNQRGIGGAAKLTLTNTVLANTTDCDVPALGGTGSIQRTATCGAAITGDAMLGALQDNGGTTHVRTMAPAAGSPAAGAGQGCPATDARGLPRPMSGCTSGAHQL